MGWLTSVSASKRSGKIKTENTGFGHQEANGRSRQESSRMSLDEE